MLETIMLYCLGCTQPIQIYEVKQTIIAQVTAFNTVEHQTDSTPCISASGVNICGSNSAIACPRDIDLYTLVCVYPNRSNADDCNIYICLDRTAKKYNGRFDISFDKDIKGAINFGRQKLKIDILTSGKDLITSMPPTLRRIKFISTDLNNNINIKNSTTHYVQTNSIL